MRAPPTILAIDTATETCSVALIQGEWLIERAEAVGQKHSERALPMVDEVLKDAGLALADVDAFAFGAGPGSFTGLRIACGLVQGLAFGVGRPVVPVGNLRALAAAAFEPGDTLLLAAIDARMQESYCAVYRNDEALEELRAPALERPDVLPEIAREFGVSVVAGDALSVFPDVWHLGPRVRRNPLVRGSAGVIARLARGDIARGRTVRAADAAPVYVRDRVALTIEERRAGARL
jgi:tRNA threonylcarbamoyladenosine biosynthesis protein TsaB